MGFSSPSSAPTSLARRARVSFATSEHPPSGRLVLAVFGVVAGFLVAATVGLTAAHGTGRLVDLFLLGAGLLFAYAGGLELSPLVAVALVATYVALESHYGRLDSSHIGSVVAFSIVYGCAALATGALADAFRAWNHGAEAEAGTLEARDEEGLPEPDTLEGLLERSIELHGALSLLLARPDAVEELA